MKQFIKVKKEVPTWSLCYLINGDSTGLTEDEIQMVDKWIIQNGYEIISPIDYDEHFSRYPAFGLPSSVYDCECLFKNKAYENN